MPFMSRAPQFQTNHFTPNNNVAACVDIFCSMSFAMPSPSLSGHLLGYIAFLCVCQHRGAHDYRSSCMTLSQASEQLTTIIVCSKPLSRKYLSRTAHFVWASRACAAHTLTIIYEWWMRECAPTMDYNVYNVDEVAAQNDNLNSAESADARQQQQRQRRFISKHGILRWFRVQMRSSHTLAISEKWDTINRDSWPRSPSASTGRLRPKLQPQLQIPAIGRF